MSGFDTSVVALVCSARNPGRIDSMSIDEVIGLYVMARRGRVHPPEAGRRAAEIHMTLPGRTKDDAGFTDEHGRHISPDEWVEWRTGRLAVSPKA